MKAYSTKEQFDTDYRMAIQIMNETLNKLYQLKHLDSNTLIQILKEYYENEIWQVKEDRKYAKRVLKNG